jgi:hypothetical protein
MPAEFTIKKTDIKNVLKELRELDPNLVKELRVEMRSALKPTVTKLAGGIPPVSPLSGFASPSAKGTRYFWTKVRGTTKTPLGKRGKKPGTSPVVSMSFKSTGKPAGFEIMELAGSRSSGLTPQGRNMISALNRIAPIQKGLGRFLIPNAKNEIDNVVKVARKIVDNYAAKVNRRIK